MAPIIIHTHAMENNVLNYDIINNNRWICEKESRLDLASKMRLFLKILNAFPMHVE